MTAAPAGEGPESGKAGEKIEGQAVGKGTGSEKESEGTDGEQG